MKKQAYLDTPIVQEFIQWIVPRISGEVAFEHTYTSSRSKQQWSCTSIYNAFENYSWRFSCNLPDSDKTSGNTFQESKAVLGAIEKGLRQALQQAESGDLLAYSASVLQWGGVLRSNYDYLENLGDGIDTFFESAVTRLDPETVDTNDDFSGLRMNSGFTKIYSLLIDNFVIYDSRVGAALGLLIRLFLEEKQIENIPNELKFAYGNARPTKGDTGPLNRRNPSQGSLKFPLLTNDDKKHIDHNIRANWLLKELAGQSTFSTEPSPIRALESALFMIGYAVN